MIKMRLDYQAGIGFGAGVVHLLIRREGLTDEG